MSDITYEEAEEAAQKLKAFFEQGPSGFEDDHIEVSRFLPEANLYVAIKMWLDN